MAAPLTRQQIKDATTRAIREEYGAIIDTLAIICDRNQRVQTFHELVKNLSEDGKTLLEMASLKERQHIDHVRKTMAKIPEFSKDRPLHDFSKDEMYFFVTSSKFDFAVTNIGMDALFQLETERHYSLERHHEQHERINNVHFDADDIREMAVDRMSRGIQTNQGTVNLTEMARYVPNFPLGDNQAKQKEFNKYVLEHKKLTEDTYREIVSSY